jgi:LmbE family N-acetylglucosaminyl deacetylase
MNPLRFLVPTDRPPIILFLGAHCDDIEIGCGGTILRLRESMPEAEIRWLILSSNEVRRAEAMASANRFLGQSSRDSLRIESFRDGYLPYVAAQVKDVFEEIKHEISPDLIFTHYRQDLHQDHRLVNELTWNTWRDHMILEYEIPKYDGDLGQPNLFVAISAEHVERKVKTVLEVFGTQTSKDWFDADTLRAMLRLRGVESNAPERYAEAFYARKLVLDLGSR